MPGGFRSHSSFARELSSRKGPQNGLPSKVAADQPDIGKSRAAADIEGYTVSAWPPKFDPIGSANPVLSRIRTRLSSSVESCQLATSPG